MDNKKGCGHTGKFVAGGQTSIPMQGQILVITSVVCGECGMSTLQIRFVALNPEKKEEKSGIITPKEKKIITGN
jgi:hypothetical protein